MYFFSLIRSLLCWIGYFIPWIWTCLRNPWTCWQFGTQDYSVSRFRFIKGKFILEMISLTYLLPDIHLIARNVSCQWAAKGVRSQSILSHPAGNSPWLCPSSLGKKLLPKTKSEKKRKEKIARTLSGLNLSFLSLEVFAYYFSVLRTMIICPTYHLFKI